MTYVETNDIYPTARQEREAMKQAMREARDEVEDAFLALNKAKKHFAWMGADRYYEDCCTGIAVVEDLKDLMEAEQ